MNEELAGQGPVERRVRPLVGWRTWGDGSRCDHCCNGDRCDDSTHGDRMNCPPTKRATTDPAPPHQRRTT